MPRRRRPGGRNDDASTRLVSQSQTRVATTAAAGGGSARAGRDLPVLTHSGARAAARVSGYGSRAPRRAHRPRRLWDWFFELFWLLRLIRVIVVAMRFALLAVVLGMSLFLQSAAVLALEGGAAAPGLWWLTLLPVLAAHSVAGFVAIGGASEFASGRWQVALGCAGASVATTVLTALVAILLARWARIEVAPTFAVFIVVVSLLVSTVASIAVSQKAIVPEGKLVPKE